MNSTAAINTTTTTSIRVYITPETYEIVPYASYTAMAIVALFALLIIIARLVITAEGQQSDLVLFNKSPQKHLLLLVSKQLYNNNAAQNNIASAIANGLMEPPQNYDPTKIPTSVANSAIKSVGMTHLIMNDISTKTSVTTLSSSLDMKMNKLDSFEAIEPVNKSAGKRTKW